MFFDLFIEILNKIAHILGPLGQASVRSCTEHLDRFKTMQHLTVTLARRHADSAKGCHTYELCDR